MNSKLKIILVVSCLFLLFSIAIASAAENRTVVDSRGVSVEIPADIHRVVTIDDGLVESVMSALGVENTLVGVGSSCLQSTFNYTYNTVSGSNYTYDDGMNVVTYLHPEIRNLPLIAEDAVNAEALAALSPDVVFLRVGDCTLWTNDVKDEMVQKTISSIESLGIPVVVLYGPSDYDTPDISKISDEIKIVGSVFGKEDQAAKISGYLEDQVAVVTSKTANLSDDKKPTVLMFGLSPSARKEGGAGVVFGTDTIDSYIIENAVNAKNAFQDTGYFKVVNPEQVLSMNPDAIVLVTAAGYHPPRELYEAPYYQNLQELKAVKDKRVTALPWTPCRCTERIEYPIDVMLTAKAAYPELFSDVDLNKWVLDFYKNVYGVNETTAENLKSAQWLDWISE